jgi:hypothetical protein
MLTYFLHDQPSVLFLKVLLVADELGDSIHMIKIEDEYNLYREKLPTKKLVFLRWDFLHSLLPGTLVHSFSLNTCITLLD